MQSFFENLSKQNDFVAMNFPILKQGKDTEFRDLWTISIRLSSLAFQRVLLSDFPVWANSVQSRPQNLRFETALLL
jgi:hypothetical protein